jgi:hypothetical protein
VVKLKGWLAAQAGKAAPPDGAAHWAAALAEIEEFQKDPAKFVPARELETPPGQPIGGDDSDEDW